MRLHFIAIGGSAMHNLAIALLQKGFQITGSDDEIFEPSKSRLARHGLLPKKMGWNSNNINDELDGVVLGMHARADNPELAKAQELGVKIFSYPEYLYEASKNKTRVVIGGSHGKTSITAMILHVLQDQGIDIDYMVGAQLEGFDTMVKITDAPVIILEGDEYLSSPIDRRSKFHLYHPHIAVLSGIAWDHINVFPTFENYLDQFRIYLDKVEKNGSVIYCELDNDVKKIVEACTNDVKKLPYGLPKHFVKDGISVLEREVEEVPLAIFGNHNLQNLNGAQLVCAELGVSEMQFDSSIQSFTGASKRLELVAKNNNTSIYKDFAHSPSKLKATTSAVKEQFDKRTLIACMELHTFSSLNPAFLHEYEGAMNAADEAIVYFNPETISHKKLPELTECQVKSAFGKTDLKVFTSSKELKLYLLSFTWQNRNLLLMSSGNFDGISLNELAEEILN